MRAFFIMSTIAVFIGLPFSSTAEGAPVTPAADTAELETRLEAIRKENGVPGMGVAVVNRDGTPWARGFGEADVAAHEPVGADTLFRVGSISKMFAALAVLELVEEGALDLESRVRVLVPEVAFENAWEATDPVRVVHLLEHTTGWDDIHPKEFAHNDPGPATLAEGLAVGPESRISRWRPGTRFSYCNSGPAVAAAIVEKTTGTRFEDYVKRTLFEPIGMPTADYFHTPGSRARLATLYRFDGRTPIPYWHDSLRPSGALNASPSEMGAFLRFLLRRGAVDGGRILSENSLERMETPVSSYGAKAGLAVGYGLCNEAVFDSRGFLWRSHGGALEGARAFLAYMPERGVGFFVAVNGESDGAIGAAFAQLSAYLTSGEPDLVRPPARAVPDEISRAYAGWYEPASPRNQNRAFLERIQGLTFLSFGRSGLEISPLVGADRKYVAVSRSLFRHESVAAANVALTDTPDGRLYIWNSATYRKVSSWRAWTAVLLAVLFLVAAATVPLFALVWCPRWFLGRLRGVPLLRVRALPLGAWVSLFVAIALIPGLLFAPQDVAVKYGRMTVWSVTLTAAVAAFAALSAASAVAGALAWRRRREMNRLAYAHSLFASAIFLVAAIYMAWNGVIGYRSWA